MVRGSLLLDADAKTGPITWKVVGRADQEYKTPYLKDLERLNQEHSPGGPGSRLMDQYNRADLREYYADFSPVDRINLRIGKQQVVWGETDFFRALDLVNGFDYRWRSFLEREGDELRKPLFLIKTKINVPEADGSLQLLFRPGIDRNRDVGNSYDLYGGRWAGQPYKGVDFLAPGALNYNYRQPGANVQDKTGGVRWEGIAGPVNYSLAYLKTFSNDPVVNSAFAPSGTAPTGALGDFIFPKIDLFGATVSGYVPAIDSVLSTELVYTRNAPYNVGTNFFGGALPGFGGIIKKDLVTTMVRIDKNLNLTRLLGTSRPSFFSVQVFDKWIQNYKPSDDIVNMVGYGAAAKEHSTIATVILGLNYKNDKINPQLAAGVDLQGRGGFLIPSVEFVYGNHWRLVLEADLFFSKNQRSPGQVEGSTRLFGSFANNDQFIARLTRQF
ncbi:hypothetical protein OR16_21893 [Cupriavidus basilensis OR16]|uniref:Uncharacterized protein n=1 Tax=Cupriavidus basilensis OR16 TaxID=1127483 RepID=H1S8Q7_9BURK|nr:DUF1302 family protein [Cupriavidus basilensis]EHP41099.1 hypothetical protein OR16_21893 [Cupriavidus basilensis OR16]